MRVTTSIRGSSVWIKDTSNEERKTLTAAFAGYATDAFDFMIYPMLIPTLIAVWGITKAQAATSLPVH